MDEDWRNAFGILMCAEICDGAGTPSTSSSIASVLFIKGRHEDHIADFQAGLFDKGSLYMK